MSSETLPAGSWRPRRPDETPCREDEVASDASLLPPLVHVAPENVEVLPCGVVKLKGVLSQEAQQRMWDGVVCAGFDYRAVEGEVNQGANTWCTTASAARLFSPSLRARTLTLVLPPITTPGVPALALSSSRNVSTSRLPTYPYALPSPSAMPFHSHRPVP